MADELECVVKAQLILPPHRRLETLVDLRSNTPLTEHIADLHEMFGGLEALELLSSDLALWIPAHARWLTAEDWAQGLAQKRFWIVEGATLQLKLSPERAAADAIWQLLEAEDAASVLAVCGELPRRLMDRPFCAGFIEHGGVEALLTVATHEVEDEPAAQQALSALSSALAFPAAVERLLAAGGTAELVRITHADPAASEHAAVAVTLALDVLCALCSRGDGFMIVHGAAVKVSAETNEPSHTQLVRLVEDVEVGVELHERDDAFAEQLGVHEQLCREDVPSSWGAARKMHYRATKLSAQLRDLKRSMQPYATAGRLEAKLRTEVQRLRDGCALAGEGSPADGVSPSQAVLVRVRRFAKTDGGEPHADLAAAWREAREEVTELQIPYSTTELEAAFGAAAPSGSGGGEGGAAKPAKPAVTKALDPKRSNAVAIMMSSLPPVHAVKAAIGALDEKALSREQLEKVRAHLPTAEEAELINSQDGPDVKWDKPESFLLALLSIPRLKQRLRCWSIKYGFSERVAELDELTETIAAAVKAVKTSAALPVVFGAVVALGNHLNGGTPKGQSDGFALTDLGKLTVAKDNANAASLLEYALSLPAAAEGLALPDELAPLREAKAKLADVRAGLQKLVADAKELGMASKPASGEGAAPGDFRSAVGGDPFTRTMGRFAEHANRDVTRVTSRLAEVEKQYAQLLTWLKVKGAGSAKAIETDELFALLVEFADAVKAAAPKKAPPKAQRGFSKKDMLAAKSARLSADAGTPTSKKLTDAHVNQKDAAPPLDPMLSKLKKTQAAADNPAAMLATAMRTGDGGAAGLKPASGGQVQARPLRARAESKVDKKLQERLQARFEKAQSRKVG